MSTGRYGSPMVAAYGAQGWLSILDADLRNASAAIDRQADLYEAGSGLAYATAEAVPALFYSTPGTDTEARQRAAFWLFVAARARLGQHQSVQARALYEKAVKLQTRANMGMWKPGGESTLNIQRIVEEAAALAKANGAPDIAGLLSNQVADPTKVTAAVERAEKADLGTQALNVAQGKRPDGSRPWGWYVVGGVVAVGALLLLARPYVQVARAALPQRTPPTP